MSKYYIGDYGFNTKGAAKDFIKIILNRNRSDPRLLSSEEDIILKLFCSRESNKYKTKLSNISYIYIRPNGKGSNEFVIKTFDNIDIPFSYLKCFNEKPPRSKFTDACRCAIIPHKPFCPEGMVRHHTGIKMSEIIDMFISEYNIDIYSINYSRSEFKDIWLRILFYEFHDKYAKYQIVTPEEHKKIHNI